MYNRYVPQPDGSYRRNRMPDNSPPRHEQKHTATPQPHHIDFPPEPPQKPCVQGSSIGGFLRQLLPKDFDTADLVIVLLLLLMAGDNEKERNTALLTMALYFIM